MGCAIFNRNRVGDGKGMHARKVTGVPPPKTCVEGSARWVRSARAQFGLALRDGVRRRRGLAP
jgi:hypothetical protein